MTTIFTKRGALALSSIDRDVVTTAAVDKGVQNTRSVIDSAVVRVRVS
jgi:hypothetical protein